MCSYYPSLTILEITSSNHHFTDAETYISVKKNLQQYRNWNLYPSQSSKVVLLKVECTYGLQGDRLAKLNKVEASFQEITA